MFSCWPMIARFYTTVTAIYGNGRELVKHRDSLLWQDKKRVLSALQYVIEKDMNFASTVFVADVELGHRGPAKEDEKTQELLPGMDGSHEEDATEN
ncbi:hypothetical protein BaRGS_00036160 [Batillaria attramentaria]|uniref:Uncharacterized protein n=1 Tax=Batillaria attramentaria TaxID=370345 RepID=A0ABD0JCG4_9CAEN